MLYYKLTVVQRLSLVLETGTYYDIEFLFNNGKKVLGHKLIYALSSPVFGAMFFGDMAELGVIEIQDVEPEAFKTMAQFLYTDKLELSSVSHAISVYIAGDKYHVPNLVKLVEEFIIDNVNAEDCLQALEFAELRENKKIIKFCIKVLQYDAKYILRSDKFVDCKLSTLETIVQTEELNISEVELFNRVEEWAKYHSEKEAKPLNDVRQLLNKVISNVRFLSMTAYDFISSPNKSELLTLEEKHSLLENISEPNISPLPDMFSKCSKFRSDAGSLTFKSLCMPSHCLKKNKVMWRKEGISKVSFYEHYYSPTFYLDDYPFRIDFVPNIYNGIRSLGLFLRCDCEDDSHGEDWSCVVDYSFKISGKKQLLSKSLSGNFCRRVEGRGWPSLLAWTDFIGGYVLYDDSVFIELYLKMGKEIKKEDALLY